MNGRVQRAKGAFIRPQIGNDRHAGAAIRVGVVGDDDRPIDHAAEPRELAIEHGHAAGRGQSQPGFVPSPEASRLAAREDGSRPHQNRVAGRRVSEK